ncbi:MAG: 30S ribosomal protein S6 [Planctomycetota bacterium]
MNIYEGMFVLDDKRANENWDGVTKEVRGILEKYGAKIFKFERWDERRLAYRIKGRSRGVYLLTGFVAKGRAIQDIERDCKLNDHILRVLIIRDDQTEKLQKQGLFDPDAPEGKPQPEGDQQEDQSPAQQEQDDQDEQTSEQQSGDGDEQAKEGQESGEAPQQPAQT